MNTDRHEHILTGLDAVNPLGFMAALGCLRVLDDAARGHGRPAPRLCFRHLGYWRPVLATHLSTIESVVACLHDDLAFWKESTALDFSYAKAADEKSGKAATKGKRVRDLKPPPEVFRSFARTILAQASFDRRREIDMVSAWATDVATDDQGATKPTHIHFTAGQQQFLAIARALLFGADKTPGLVAADLEKAIIGPWSYTGRLPVLGWDAGVERIYALRATDPSSGKDRRGVPGADWLALCSLPFFQTAPRRDKLYTVACDGSWKNGRFVWPLWTAPAAAPSVASLLRGGDWMAASAEQHHARGIAVVLESRIQRTKQGGYGSFRPARPVHCERSGGAKTPGVARNSRNSLKIE